MSFFCDDLIAVDDLGPFIHYLIFKMSILADNSMRQYNAVFNDSTGFDLASTSDNGIFDCSFDQTAIGDNRILDRCTFQILSGEGIIGSCVDWPIRIEKCICCLEVDQRDIGIVVAVKSVIEAKKPLWATPRISSSPARLLTICGRVYMEEIFLAFLISSMKSSFFIM